MGNAIIPGGGSFSLVSRVIASNVAAVDFTNLGAFKHYMMIAEDIVPATDTAIPQLRISTDNGTSWKSGAADYGFVNERFTYNSATSNIENSLSATAIGLQYGTGYGNTSSDTSGISIQMYNPGGAGRCKFSWEGVTGYGGGGLIKTIGVGHYATAGAVNGMRFLLSTGNITSGQFSLYGVS